MGSFFLRERPGLLPCFLCRRLHESRFIFFLSAYTGSSAMRGSLVSALPGFQVASALYMAWCLARLAVNTPYPAMVVLTESMVPAFHPGDVIFLWNRTELIQVGDIPVIWFEADPLPMVHRALSIAHG
jgi:signal peptidase